MMRFCTIVIVTAWAAFTTYQTSLDDPPAKIAVTCGFALMFWALAVSAIWKQGRDWDY